MDIHIINGDGKGNWDVVMHFDIPDANNAVGVNVRTALVNSGFATTPSVLVSGDGTDGTISAAEQAALADGSVFEHVATLHLDGPGADTASRIALVQERYAELNSQVISQLQSNLDFYGATASRI